MVSEQYPEQWPPDSEPSAESISQIERCLGEIATRLPEWHHVYCLTFADIVHDKPVDVQMSLCENHSGRSSLALRHTTLDGAQTTFVVDYCSDPAAIIPEAKIAGSTPEHAARFGTILKGLVRAELFPKQIVEVVNMSGLLDHGGATVSMPSFEKAISGLSEWCVAANAVFGYDCRGAVMLDGDDYYLRVLGQKNLHYAATSVVHAAFCLTPEWMYAQEIISRVMQRGVLYMNDQQHMGREIRQAALAGMSQNAADMVSETLGIINLELAYNA